MQKDIIFIIVNHNQCHWTLLVRSAQESENQLQVKKETSVGLYC